MLQGRLVGMLLGSLVCVCFIYLFFIIIIFLVIGVILEDEKLLISLEFTLLKE